MLVRAAITRKEELLQPLPPQRPAKKRASHVLISVSQQPETKKTRETPGKTAKNSGRKGADWTKVAERTANRHVSSAKKQRSDDALARPASGLGLGVVL